MEAMRGRIGISKLILLALLAMSAIGVSEAQASVLMTEGNVAATLSGEQVEGEPLIFEAGTGENRGEGVCSTVKFTTKFASPATEVTVSPEYAGCEFQVQAVDPNTTGCGYRFYGFTFTKIGTYHGSVDFVCPPGKQMDTTMTVAGKAVCIVTVLPTKNIGVAEETFVPPGIMIMSVKVTSALKIKFDSLVLGGCQGESSEAEMEDGSLTGSLTVSATNESGKSVPLTME
jgi:hypothetical protein